MIHIQLIVVPNIKDINFWEQFTTITSKELERMQLFRISKISTFESNSQHVEPYDLPEKGCSEYQRYQLLRAIHNLYRWFRRWRKVVPNIKDINFWEQFTTYLNSINEVSKLFRISKISTFESNSQPLLGGMYQSFCCSEYQRYQLLRAIHNFAIIISTSLPVVPNIKDINFWEQFTTPK